MLSYITKRFLILLLTLFGITVIQFVIINSMPGRPTSGNLVVSEDTKASDQFTTESDRKWRESYHLDKPVLFNTRPWIKRDHVEKVIQQRISGKPIEKMRAAWELDDLGSSIVKHLVDIANDSSLSEPVRHMAVVRLPVNIERRKTLPNPDWSADSQDYIDAMKLNQSISEENGLADQHSMKDVTHPTHQDIDFEAKWWNDWYKKNKSRFEYNSTAIKMWDLFFETRFAYFFSNLLQGDFGESRKKTRVIDEISERLPVTLILNAVSFFFIYLLALPIGILGAVKRAGYFDNISTIVLFLLYSLPSFYVGLILVSGTTNWLNFFPSGDWESLGYEDLTTWERFKDRAWHSVLPLIVMVYGSLAYLSRFARTGLLDIIESDYIRTARAKGLSEWIVVMKHALRNGALPVLTLLGSLLPGLFGGSVIIEVIFNLRGVNLLFFESIASQDYSVISAVMFISAVLVLISLFLVDVLYTILDPRISFDAKS
jgi:peptide/nickel transport system permease protein